MVVLKKVKAATLIETLTASVLIVVVFMVASLVLNNVFKNTVQVSKVNVNARINELYYLGVHEKLKLPYSENFENFEIEVYEENENIRVSFSEIKR